MTIEQIDSGKVLIMLKNSDMKDFSLEYGTMGFDDPHSRRILSRLLSLACSKTGLNARNKKMVVEALPHKSGCLILLTLKEKKRRVYRIKRSDKLFCCVFDDAEALLSALDNAEGLPESELLLYEGGYYLLAPEKLSSRLAFILGEFSETYYCSKIRAAKLREAGKPLGDAREIIKKISRR